MTMKKPDILETDDKPPTTELEELNIETEKKLTEVLEKKEKENGNR